MSTPINGSILKAFAILDLFDGERSEISAQTVASELGQNTATAHRLLTSLVAAGALTSFRRGQFALAPKLVALGRLAEEMSPLGTKVQPLLADLANTLNESVMICKLGRAGPTCIAVAAASRPISVNISIGTVLPIAMTAQGKLFLAHMTAKQRAAWLEHGDGPSNEELERIRSDGFARNRGDNEPDIGAVSVPVRDGEGSVPFTLSAFGMLSRFDDQAVDRSLKALQIAAKEVLR